MPIPVTEVAERFGVSRRAVLRGRTPLDPLHGGFKGATGARHEFRASYSV